MYVEAKVYAMQAKDGTIKIGHSVNPTERAKHVDRKISWVAYQTETLPHADVIERAAHRVMALFGKHLGGEWFEGKVRDAQRAIEIATRQVQNHEFILGGVLRPKKRRPTTPLDVYKSHFSKEELFVAEMLMLDAEAVTSPYIEQSMTNKRGLADERIDRAHRIVDVLHRIDGNTRELIVNAVLMPGDATETLCDAAKNVTRFAAKDNLRCVGVGLLKAALWRAAQVYAEIQEERISGPRRPRDMISR